MSNQVIYGIVHSRSQAEQIIQDLVGVGVGINHSDISILSSSEKDFQEFTSQNRFPQDQRVTDHFDRPMMDPMVHDDVDMAEVQGDLGTEKHTKAPEGTAIGATAGGVIGGTLGLLAGIGALAIPGLGPFIAAGPLMAFFSGLGIGGLTGGVVGALSGLGLPEYEAKNYENSLKAGGILISVIVNGDDSDQVKEVKELMARDGAQDISMTSLATPEKDNRKVA